MQNFGEGDERQPPLPACLPQQGFGPEHRGRLVVLAVDDRPSDVHAVNVSSMMDQIRLSQPTDSTGRPAAFHSG
jgi:hypothetical protein